MRIYTSYYHKVKDIPKRIVCIGVSLTLPEHYPAMLHYRKLAPYGCLKLKDNPIEYIKKYNERLSKLEARKVLFALSKMAGGSDCVLLGWSKGGEICNRHLIAQWLNKELGCGVVEYSFGNGEQKNLF